MTQIERVGPKFFLLLAVSFAGWVCGASPFLFYIIGAIAFFPLAFYFLALATWWLLLLFRNEIVDRRRRELSNQWIVWLWSVGSLVLFTICGAARGDREIQNARRFVEEVSVPLDQIKTKIGHYPHHLPNNLNKSMPAMLSYSSYGGGYSFSYSDGMMHGYAYDSNTGSWHVWD